jgi:hypothetical protein
MVAIDLSLAAAALSRVRRGLGLYSNNQVRDLGSLGIEGVVILGFVERMVVTVAGADYYPHYCILLWS